MSGMASIVRGNALDLPLADSSVDLVVTSPPYFGLRSYQDGGEHYAGQIGSEPTPAEFVDALIAATREMVRVLKPSGSIWVNLGDKYSGGNGGQSNLTALGERLGTGGGQKADIAKQRTPAVAGMRPKSLIGVPWRYAIRCIDDLGLILRAEVIWSKPNGLPESVTDRVRRSHENWFHFTREPRYFSAVDEIREEHVATATGRDTSAWRTGPSGANRGTETGRRHDDGGRVADFATSTLGKLPGSVWVVPTQPLRVPEHLGIDHFAAFPMEWPRRIIRGWSPPGVCVECGEGRRPVRDGAWHFTTPGHEVDRAALLSAQRAGVTADIVAARYGLKTKKGDNRSDGQANVHSGVVRLAADFGISQLAARNAMSNAKRGIGGDACACPEPTAPTTPAIVLDPFGGTGTVALVAKMLGRYGVSVDMSSDYCRLAEWRTNDPAEMARVLGQRKPEPVAEGQLELWA